MFGLFSSWWSTLGVLLATGLLCLYIHFKLVVATYWKKRGLPHLTPKFLAGNFLSSNFTENFSHALERVHTENKALTKVIGIWFFHKPAIMPLDVGVIKTMLIKDFNHFHDRGIDINEDVEPLTGHLFNLSGSKWRNIRVKLTPTFTSGKMKMMFPTIVDCGNKLSAYLDETVKDGGTLEIKDILARFTTDTISSCAFGIETNSLKNPDSEFRTQGKKIFDPTLYFVIVNLLVFVLPIIDKIFWFRRMPKSVSDFFLNAVRETISYRELNNTKRKDFLQLLIELKNKGFIEEADHDKEKDDSVHHATDDKFTVEQAAAQAFVFFIAGFETSSTTMMFCFYELALNPDIQGRLQSEIDEVLARHDNVLTYEGLNEMVYLDWVVLETLRKYPPVPALFRVCTKQYTLPGTTTVIDKGTPVMISLLGLQKDPEAFPDPEKFDPERFSNEEKAKRDSFFHLPFGEGPRVCIGSRFGLMQTKIGLVSILSKFTVEVTDTTPIPIVYDVKAFVLTPTVGMPLAITRR